MKIDATVEAEIAFADRLREDPFYQMIEAKMAALQQLRAAYVAAIAIGVRLDLPVVDPAAPAHFHSDACYAIGPGDGEVRVCEVRRPTIGDRLRELDDLKAAQATPAQETPQQEVMRQFVGWLSADIPELHAVEVPRLADSLDRFLATLSGRGEGP